MAAPLPSDLSYSDNPAAARMRRAGWLRIGFVVATIVLVGVAALLS